MNMRYVIYQEGVGVYHATTEQGVLWFGPKYGKGPWVPTYTLAEADELVAKLAHAGVKSVKYIVVYPDLGQNASEDACANAGLPRWSS